MQTNNHGTVPGDEAESAYAWTRLVMALLLSTIGGVGMWSVVVALPPVQAEFGVARADASLPYTLTMIGYGLSGILMGRLSDRFGIMVPVMAGTIALALGYVLAGSASSLWQFTLVQGLSDRCGEFRDVRAVACRHFTLVHPPPRHRRSDLRQRQLPRGNGLATDRSAFHRQCRLASDLRWHRCVLRGDHVAAGAASEKKGVCDGEMAAGAPVTSWSPRPLRLSSGTLQTLLIVAPLSCCVAMSMPQVHLVAYCGDLGYGAARGTQMLSLMLGCGIVSRLAFGWICDHIGGLRTLLLGSSLQALALLLFLPFDGLVSLYVISALFGLFQGGIVPSYAIIVREHFPRERGWRARRHRDDGLAVRHGSGRLGVGRDLRLDRLVRRRVRQRHPLELADHRDRHLAARTAAENRDFLSASRVRRAVFGSQ